MTDSINMYSSLGLTTSSSPFTSKVEGSGIGPSIVHLFESYLVRMKFSILLCRVSRVFVRIMEGRTLLQERGRVPALPPSIYISSQHIAIAYVGRPLTYLLSRFPI